MYADHYYAVHCDRPLHRCQHFLRPVRQANCLSWSLAVNCPNSVVALPIAVGPSSNSDTEALIQCLDHIVALLRQRCWPWPILALPPLYLVRLLSHCFDSANFADLAAVDLVVVVVDDFRSVLPTNTNCFASMLTTIAAAAAAAIAHYSDPNHRYLNCSIDCHR